MLGITIMKVTEKEKKMFSIQFHEDLLEVHYETY